MRIILVYSDADKVWDKIAYYLGVCCANLTLTLSLEKIVLGGGIMNRKILFDMIRKHFHASLNGYIAHPSLYSEEEIQKHGESENKGLKDYIVGSMYGDSLGIIASAYVGYSSEQRLSHETYSKLL